MRQSPGTLHHDVRFDWIRGKMAHESGSRDSGLIGVRRLAGVAEITDHAGVKAAAKAWGAFSSDLLGDRDVRTYRQLPLEIDPPAHTGYRAILTPVFGRQEVGALEPQLRAVARDLIAGLARRGSMEAITELALPMVVASIGIAFGRPQDVAELQGWGVDAWHTQPDGTRDGSQIDAYLARVFDEVVLRPGDDVFSRIAGGSIDGRPLSWIEMIGMGNLILAGGRDTVIHLIVGALWHLASHREARVRLAADPARIKPAVDELLRFLSPLARMERIATGDVAGPWGQASRGDIVLLGFAAANHDPAVFADPGVVRLDRSPNPHVAFGNGPHTCIGVHLARMEAHVFLEELLAAVPDWRVGAGARIDVERFGGSNVPVHFHALPIEVGA
jgi:cytochrome P450